MKAAESAARRLASGNGITRDSVYLSYRISHQQRSASTATAAAETLQNPAHDTSIPPIISTDHQKAYRLLASPLLSRPPQLTRELTSFEKSYYLYQKRLNERSALPFSRYFYYKKGTPSDVEWKRKVAARKTAARDIGVYSGYGKEAWNDEVLVGSKLGEPDSIVENLARDAEGRMITNAEPVGDKEAVDGTAIGGDARAKEGTKKELELQVERPMPRRTEADERNDLMNPNRRLDRTLYLLVKRQDGTWRFPEDRVYGRENLREATSRIIAAALGPNIHTWTVANHPVAYYGSSFKAPDMTKVPKHPDIKHSVSLELEEYGEKVFFMKGRVMAGQVDLKENQYGNREWAWLSKDEVQEKVTEEYWRAIRNSLAER
ncbi:hypothetical protein K431DRAFT_309008 [Polychaeton citri CBS 116435]|uniref:Large ribosomal subunit protein mL46 n=1 Tax=Polychaeton citri CBS 116435 TaxID=1314669 RepID=A0A9P4UTD6_9PEZI|nr:hypothetical protein K431DRAFT_309008 [Polychaeton citri CBS 116435]